MKPTHASVRRKTTAGFTWVEELDAIRSGNSPGPQLYQISEDPTETRNLAKEHPEKRKELAAMLAEITGRSSAGKSN